MEDAILNIYLNNLQNWNVQFRHKSSYIKVQFGQAASKLFPSSFFPPAQTPGHSVVNFKWKNTKQKSFAC